MTSSTRFASATREELWIDGRLAEWRLTHGEALQNEDRIVVTDSPDALLVEGATRELDALRAAIPASSARRVRYVTEASTDGTVAVAVLSDGTHSVITTPEFFRADSELLRRAAGSVPRGATFDYRGVPLHWLHGSGSVLLHEAAGHPAEHGHDPIAWPSWLSVHDRSSDLLRGGRPAALRRASFADLPLCRMKEVRVAQHGAPLPEEGAHVEILLVEGGSYEPLREEVTIHVAAARLAEASGAVWLAPFEIRETRSGIARSLVAARGDAERYPGVVCSREGQEVLVDSFAPLIVTVFA